MGAASNVGMKESGTLGGLVRENAESIEPGLRIVDSGVLLGHATIDMVGLDSRGSLALIALDATADDGLLLRVLEACSWCAEYSDTVRRLYPTAQIRSGETPRAIIIAERLPDSFLRKIRQLGLSEIDCLEFRHFQVNGATAAHFYQVERVRRTPACDQSGGTDVRRAEAPASPVEMIQAAAPAAPVAHPAGNGNGKPARPAVEVVEAPAVTPAAETPKLPRNEWEEFLSQLGTGLAGEANAPRAEAPAVQPEIPAVPPEIIEKFEITQAAAPAAPVAHPAGNGNGKPAQPAVEVPEMIAVTSVIDALDAQREEWQEMLTRLGTLHLPKNGTLSREWREFLTQLLGAQ